MCIYRWCKRPRFLPGTSPLIHRAQAIGVAPLCAYCTNAVLMRSLIGNASSRLPLSQCRKLCTSGLPFAEYLCVFVWSELVHCVSVCITYTYACCRMLPQCCRILLPIIGWPIFLSLPALRCDQRRPPLRLTLDIGEGEVDAARVGVLLVAVPDDVWQRGPYPLHQPV